VCVCVVCVCVCGVCVVCVCMCVVCVCVFQTHAQIFFVWAGGILEADAVAIHTSYLISKTMLLKRRHYNYNASLFAAAFMYT